MKISLPFFGKKSLTSYQVALTGNPNTGKSTLFNALTGMNQHTGNWPGKTVTKAEGYYSFGGSKYSLIDLPGTYSLFAASMEEEVVQDYLLYTPPDATVVVADASFLERNLNLILQVIELTPKSICCLNLLDEAERMGIRVDLSGLSKELGVPVVGTSARNGYGLEELKQTIEDVVTGKIYPSPKTIVYDADIEQMIENLTKKLLIKNMSDFPLRWLALRILQGDEKLLKALYTSGTNSISPMLERKVLA